MRTIVGAQNASGVPFHFEAASQLKKGHGGIYQMETLNRNLAEQATPDTLSRLKSIVIRILNIRLPADQIPSEANLYKQFGLDSITTVDLFLAIEKEFNIDLKEEELDTSLFENLSILNSFVERKLQA
jgi:acyl carrier protein